MNTSLAAAGLYAALCFFILAWLGNETGKLRRKHKIAVGDGGLPHLTRIMRGHANAAENMPIFFIMLIVSVLLGMPAIATHVLGLAYVAGRAIHAWHFIQEDAPGWQRFGGFGISTLAAVVLAIGLVVHAVWTILF